MIGKNRTRLVATFSPENPTDPSGYITRGTITGTPLNWRDDVTGGMESAVMAYLNQGQEEVSPEHLQLVIAYIQHHIHAPCFLEESPFGEVDPWMSGYIIGLRQKALNLKTVEDVNEYIDAAMEVGLDPL